MKKKCIICGNIFEPDKYHPHQKVCKNSGCQHMRQLTNQEEWRANNPNYFRYKERQTEWEKRRARYLRHWRETHKDYFKEYRKRKT